MPEGAARLKVWLWQVRVWDVNTLKCLATLTGHSGAVRALAASSKRVFSGSDDTTIKVEPCHHFCLEKEMPDA